MARNPHVFGNELREKRQQSYRAAPEVAAKFPGVEELVVEMRFADPEHKVSPSPQRRIFAPEMQAFFDFQCPLRDCTGGGFDLSDTILGGTTKRKIEQSGTQTCRGKRPRNGSKGTEPCNLELQFQVIAHRKGRVAA